MFWLSMTDFAATLIAIIAGTTIVINGVFLNNNDVLEEAKRVSNLTNRHQLATVLELYYLDHNTYPEVTSGTALIETLYNEGYLDTKPRDPSIFKYKINNQEDYSLSVE